MKILVVHVFFFVRMIYLQLLEGGKNEETSEKIWKLGSPTIYRFFIFCHKLEITYICITKYITHFSIRI